MASTKSDFAHPACKTAGCFVALSALPLVLLLHAFGSQVLPWPAFVGGAVITLAGLGALCGQPNTIVQAVRAICAVLCRRVL